MYSYFTWLFTLRNTQKLLKRLKISTFQPNGCKKVWANTQTRLKIWARLALAQRPCEHTGSYAGLHDQWHTADIYFCTVLFIEAPCRLACLPKVLLKWSCETLEQNRVLTEVTVTGWLYAVRSFYARSISDANMVEIEVQLSDTDKLISTIMIRKTLM